MNIESGDLPGITITRESKTPESPLPIQPPQPLRIPVLQNQHNPVFNLVTSHTSPPFALRNLTAMDHELANDATTQEIETTIDGNVAAEDLESTLTKDAEETTGTEQPIQEQSADNNNQSTSINEPVSELVEQPDSNLSTSNPIPSAEPAEKITTSNPFTEADAEDEPENELVQAENVSAEPVSSEVNYQALLDQIGLPSSNPTSIGNTSLLDPALQSSVQSTTNNGASIAGLPPRPPPQDQTKFASSNPAEQDNGSFQFPPSAVAANTAAQIPNNAYPQPGSFPNPNLQMMAGLSSNGLPPPPLPSFQQPPPSFTQQLPQSMHERSDSQASRYDDEKKWPPHVQQMYEEFLKEEEFYTKDGAWDKFPLGSRLFVGNLPTEVVTKRDIFHCFFRFGKIAQISIKQAYGFVQFMDKEACTAALHGEQGAKIKDRSMHLEVSKPPKSRTGGTNNRNDRNRRSRSPESRRPDSAGLGRNGRKLPSNDFRDETRRRDDYRPGRSPSPRGYRHGDNYRDRSPGRYRDRSRSPRGRGSKYGRSPSPNRHGFDEDDGVPIPRRHHRDVPDVQLLLVDDLDKPFIDYLEKAFRDRGLRTGVLFLPHVPIQSLVKRQIVEGVQAVVKVSKSTRNTGRIPVQVFDRTAGAANVRFDDYDNLDANTAAELVVRAKAKEATALSHAAPQYSAPAAYPPAPFGAAALQQAVAQQPNLANLISSLDGPALQTLLSAMQQPAANAIPQPQSQPQPDIQALLGSLGRAPPSQNQAPSASYSNYQQPQAQPPQAAFGAFPPTQQPSNYTQQYPTASPTTNVQGVLDRLGRWKQ